MYEYADEHLLAHGGVVVDGAIQVDAHEDLRGLVVTAAPAVVVAVAAGALPGLAKWSM